MIRSVVLAVALLLSSGALGAKPKNAAAIYKKRVEFGMQWFQLGRYDKAIAEWEKAYELFPDNDLLFKIAQAYRRNGDCAGAIPKYREILEEKRLSPEQRIKVEEAEAQCAANLSVVEPPPAPPAKPGAWYEDGLGLALAGSGVVVIAVGGVFIGLAERVEDEAVREETYGNFVDDLSSAQTRRDFALGCFLLGGGLVVGGAVRYALVGWGSPVEASAAISDEGAWFVVSGTLP